MEFDEASDKEEKGISGWWNRTTEVFDVMSYTPRAFGLLWGAHKGYTIAVIFVGILMSLIPLAELELTKLVLDSLTLSQSLEIPFLKFAIPFINYGTLILVGAIIALGWFYMLAIPVMHWCQEELGDQLTKNITSLVLHKANSFADITIFENSTFYEMLTKVESQSGYRPMSVLQEMIALLRNLVNIISMAIVILLFNPLLFVWILVLSVPSMFVQLKHQREAWNNSSFDGAESRKMYYSKLVLTTDYMAKEVRIFGLGDHFLARYMNAFDLFNVRQRKIRLSQLREDIVYGSLATLGMGGAYGFVAFGAVTHTLTIGAFTLYSAAIDRMTGSVQGLFYNITQLYDCNMFMRDLYTFLALPQTMEVLPTQFAKAVPQPIAQGIEFRNVAFSYPRGERNILQDLSFTIKPGQTVAVVGENGAGKTTVVKLLSRLYDVKQGQILIDGVDLREYDLADWRSQLGVIFQDFTHYELTARENIGLGRLSMIENLSAVKCAAERGGASDVIHKMPRKYDTYLGTYFSSEEERTTELSGGEWQRIALSRAFMRSLSESDDGNGNGSIPGIDKFTLRLGDAQLLILDEPTASLDAKAESEVYARFHELTRGKSTLLISHRFSTVRMADHIVVLDSGRVIEQGSHKELIELDGEYARMYNLQADRYKD